MNTIVNDAIQLSRTSLRVPLLRAGFCTVLAFASFGCMNTPQPIAQNSNSAAPANDRPQTSIAHGPSERQPAASNSNSGGSKWTQSGDPIDTASFDAAIAKAEKDAGDKKALAEAYLARANALTAARQYASALGDYRRTLKHDPTNAEAKEWVDQITSIYSSINRTAPKEGEEPPPLPFKGK